MFHTDSTWLELGARLQDVFLQESRGPYESLHLFPSPETQYPQIIAFIGGQIKSRALKNMFSLNAITGHQKILLRAVPCLREISAPFFIADSEMHKIVRLKGSLVEPIPGVIERHLIRWHRDIPRALEPSTLAQLVYTKLLLPFSTVVCLFADDFGGSDKLAKVLASWLFILTSRSSEWETSTYARILVLAPWTDPDHTFDEKLARTEFIQKIRLEVEKLGPSFRTQGIGRLAEIEFAKYLQKQLGEISILELSARSTRTHLKTLRARILQESQDVQSIRRLTNMAFSAHHLTAFFHSACLHFSRDIVTPFSFVQASRSPNPIPNDVSSHFATLLSLTPSGHRMTLAASAIASALCLDSFPPGAPSFNPENLLKRIYNEVFAELGKKVSFLQDETYAQIKHTIEGKFNQQALAHAKTTSNISIKHKNLLASFSSIWEGIKCNTTCLSCIMRKPENTLSCRHSLCDPCVIIYGRYNAEEPWKFILDTCPLCQTPNELFLWLKPYTAGIRVLVIDGGTHCDYEPLISLEKELWLQLPIGLRKHFDLVNGSGLGCALLVLETFWKDVGSFGEYLNSDHGRKVLHGPKEPTNEISRFSQATTLCAGEETINIGWKQWNGLLRTSFAALPRWSETLQSSIMPLHLKESFGAETTIFDSNCHGSKVGITLIKSRDSRTCIFSNYNGTGLRPSNDSLVRPKNRKGEMRLWNWDNPSNGYRKRQSSIQDGLIDLTLHEKNVIWSRPGKNPDVLLVLGAQIPVYDQPRKVKKEPLEDPTEERLKEWRIDHRLGYDHNRTIHSIDILLASLFYVELVGLPRVDEIGFLCRAQIRCRITPSAAYDVLIARLRRRAARFYYHWKTINCVDPQLRDKAEKIPFSRTIEFSVHSMHDEIDIKIDGITSRGESISNCPYILQQLVEDQGLNCVFGHKDHRKRFFGSSRAVEGEEGHFI